MKLQIPPIVFYGIVAVVILAGLQLVTTPGNPDYHKSGFVGQPAAEFSGKTAEGKEIRLSDYKGKVVVVNFWATWCSPCRAEMPGFIKLEKKYRDKDVVFIGLAVNDELPKIAKYTAEHQIVWPNILATPEVMESYGGVKAIPTTYIISRKGTIAAVVEGMAEEGPLEVEITGQL